LSEINNNGYKGTNETPSIDTEGEASYVFESTDSEDYSQSSNCEKNSEGSNSEDSRECSDFEEIMSNENMDTRRKLDEEIAHPMRMMKDEEIRIIDATHKDYSYLKEYVDEDNEEVEQLVFVEFVDEDEASSTIEDSEPNLLNLS